MKKKFVVLLSVFVAVCCAFAITVSAIDYANAGVELEKEKTYFLVADASSGEGKGAFCLANQFTQFGSTEDNISLCTKGEDGKFTIVKTIEKGDLKVWFSGKTEIKLDSSANISSFLGGIEGLGLTFDSTKTNIVFSLKSVTLETGKPYYIYIPKGYFADASGQGNKPGYIEIETSKIGCYGSDMLGDLGSIFADLTGAASLGAGALAKLFS